MSNKNDTSFRPKRPMDERDILNLPKPEGLVPEVRERETISSEGSSGALEAIGKAHEGMDGKKYIGSYAVHLYTTPKSMLGTIENVWLIQSTDLTRVPEQNLLLTIRELGRALMKRFGHKPPASTLDVKTRESVRSV